MICHKRLKIREIGKKKDASKIGRSMIAENKRHKGAFQIVASRAEVRSAHIYSPEQTSGLHICDNLKCTQA
jgi:hypothetical protein